MEQTKRCSKCDACKPATLEHFRKDAGRRDGLNSWCHDCARAYNRKYHVANRVERSEYHRGRYAAKTEQHRACARERMRLYKATNLESVRETNRQACRRYRTANPTRRASLASKRRALKLAAVDPTANQEAIAALHAEAKLAELFTGQAFAVDHITPLARGGRHHEDNLRSLPARLNSVKGAKLDSEVTDDDFRQWVYGPPTFEQVTWRTFYRGRDP
jgi:hypothetical protein